MAWGQPLLMIKCLVEELSCFGLNSIQGRGIFFQEELEEQASSFGITSTVPKNFSPVLFPSKLIENSNYIFIYSIL